MNTQKRKIATRNLTTTTFRTFPWVLRGSQRGSHVSENSTIRHVVIPHHRLLLHHPGALITPQLTYRKIHTTYYTRARPEEVIYGYISRTDPWITVCCCGTNTSPSSRSKHWMNIYLSHVVAMFIQFLMT